MISSTADGSQSGGVRPMPTPSILCGPASPPDSTADSPGSTATIRTFGLCFRSDAATPWRLADVPTDVHEGIDLLSALVPDLLAQRMVAGDAVAVVELIGPERVGRQQLNPRATSIMSLMSFFVVRPPSLGTIVSSAPSARIWSSFSRAKASDVTIFRRYPFAAQTSASDAPVLPPVYSTTVPPGLSRPSRSAAAIAAWAIRSFMLPVGFSHSHLTTILATVAGPDPSELDHRGVADGVEDVHGLRAPRCWQVSWTA